MIQASIPSYKCVDLSGSKKSYHVYSIQVHQGGRTFYLERRYSDFLQLHKELRKTYLTPEFPPKKVRNATVKVLESRRQGLEAYLQGMLRVYPIPKEVTSFLNINLHPHYQSRAAALADDQSSCTGSTGTGDYLDSFQERYAALLVNPAAAFVEDPFLDESDSSSNLSDCITRGVLDALYQTEI